MIENFQIEEMVEQTQRFVSYKAYNLQSGRKCLLKRYLIDQTSGLGKVEGWQDEFLALVDAFNRVEVPSLRTLIGGGLDPQDGNPYAVFEWFEVSSLSEVIQNNQHLDLELTKDMSKAALDAIGFLHQQGFVHGDISPQCVFYTDSEEKNPWVLNWDPIRSLRCKHGVNRFGMNIYIAPELTAGSPSNVQTDLYALGKTAEKVCGEHAKEPHFAKWISDMTASEPGYRYGSSQQARTELPETHAEPVVEEPVEPVRTEPAASRLLVGAAPAATPTAPLVTSPATRPAGGAVAPTRPATATKTAPKKPTKSGVGAGIIITISVLVLLIGGLGFMLLNKKKKPTAVVADSPLEAIEEDKADSSTSVKAADTRPANKVIASDPPAQPADASVPIQADDFGALEQLIDKKITVVGTVMDVSQDDEEFHMYLTDPSGEAGTFKFTLEQSSRDPLPEVSKIQSLFNGKTVKGEGYLDRKINNSQRNYEIFITRLNKILDASSDEPIFHKGEKEEQNKALLPGLTHEQAEDLGTAAGAPDQLKSQAVSDLSAGGAPKDGILRPTDLAKAEKLVGEEVIVEGVIEGLSLSSSKKTTYFNFQGYDPADSSKCIRLEVRTSAIEGDEYEEIVQNYVGKTVRATSKLNYKDSNYNKGYYLSISRSSVIEIVE